jgi:hypothetical protein
MTASLTEGMTASLTEGMTASLTEGMTASLTEGMTASLTEGMTASLTEGMTASLTEEIIVQSPIKPVINDIYKLLSNISINPDCETINKLINILSTIPINPHLEIKNDIQTLEINLTFGDLFNIIKSKHWHSNIDKTKTSYHSESLYDHSINTAIATLNNALSVGLSTHKCLIMFLLGLFHDIGKPATYNEGAIFIGFKGHGPVGSAIVDNLWSDAIEDILNISKDEWGNICVCIAVHMCGYFLTQTSPYHKFYLSSLSRDVKEMISILRKADQISLVPHGENNIKETEIQLNETQEAFNESIKDKDDSDICSFLEDTKLNKGLIIYINGTSASGKTTYALKIIEKLKSIGIDKKMICNISRDLYIINYYLKNNKSSMITDQEINPELYQKAYAFYELNHKENFKIINLEISNDIAKTLINGGIVVIHSLITRFPSINTIIPDIAINTPKISIWIDRNKLITTRDAEDRLGISIDLQIKLHGDCNFVNPLSSHNLNWYNLISITEFDDHDIIKRVDKSRPHLTLTTGWNNCCEKNINYLLENLVKKIYNYNQSISKLLSLEDVTDMTDIQLLEYLGSIDKIKEFFNLYHYKVYIIGDIVGIKYIDGINKIWRPLWARKMRGKYYHVNPITSKITVIKDSLIRGMEILPKKYEKYGITKTQDINAHDDITNFDAIQQELITLFKGDNELTRETFITLKVDGSLIIVNICPPKCDQYTIMNNIIEIYGDEFSKLLADYCKINKLPLFFISTNGTLLIGNLMIDYFLTAIQKLVSVKVKSLSDWKKIIPKFTEIFMEYYKNLTRLLKNNNPVSLCFEAICKNRTTFLGNVHTELAINYDSNNLILLGLCNNNKYYPHFKLPRIIFTQPWYMCVKNTTEVFNILDMMNEIVCETIDKNELFKMGPDNDSLMSTDLHVEGLILLSYLSNGSIDYEKIKTTEYYECHNINIDTITTVTKYHRNYDNYYPIIKNIRQYIENLKPSLLKMINTSFILLTQQINKLSPFYIKLNEDAKKCVDKIINNIENKKDTKNNIGTAVKIFLNNKNIIEDINKLFTPLIEEIYKNRVGAITDFIIFIKNILMTVKPWINDPEVMIDQLIENKHNDNKIIGQLYILIIGIK